MKTGSTAFIGCSMPPEHRCRFNADGVSDISDRNVSENHCISGRPTCTRISYVLAESGSIGGFRQGRPSACTL